MKGNICSDFGFIAHVRHGRDGVRHTGDIHYEKVLAIGDVLRSKRPSGKTDVAIGKTLFSEILRLQLRVSADAFWDCVGTGKPAERPGRPPDPPSNSLPLWLALRLFAEVGLREDEIRGMTEDDGHRLLNEARSRPR